MRETRLRNVVAYAQAGDGPTAIVESVDLRGNYVLRILSYPADTNAVKIKFRTIGYAVEEWQPVSDTEAEFCVRGPRGRILARDLRPYITGIQSEYQRTPQAAE